MREIKFRAWDKQEKEMFMPDTENNNEIFFAGFVNGVLRCSESQYDEDDDFILMQYTGLKDKNGKDIYEGDLVNNEDNETAVIIYETGSFLLQYPDSPLDFDSLFDFQDDRLEIIGNIYQNPELLEGEYARDQV
ncbi:YopX family protein [Aneurinibacillus migulanus]|uniref:Phage uncharacterized protein TIGR01671 n=1 Tax=Aneurinibacillus migulanus TaxID=47500 RepID=A0A0D1Y199_ANEMI|nr:YopX family protein [Aneurinibacillus migulanus]KIV60311.1 hypothetical protein TS65_00595 [Aneurinibacillus migulanus]KON90489.1 hypothetical protein AF333_28820 [Aneurinibacillus migulanus]MED0894938.1 YopX family protein [Aneurinibacillus migulanus]MED1614419.1 YopX family protein [Aneurinibacillus migulanus]SDJ78334.1 phage uncharacterized protein TIGR01671 [Aneurinibacillus migulanus]